ncbi:MAG TPA: MoxR family ATPase [Planctomycetia bacterium]|nr:MoxR family ATPase [Planctomycetia bacterium]
MPDPDGAASESAAPRPEDVAAIERLAEAHRSIRAEVHKVIVGQDDVLEQLLIAIFARGHCLLEGVPGLAKTLMVRTVADALSLTFRRIQFTPDLMPADITGTEVIGQNRDTGEREFKFLPGPIFGNLILADEINRTPPKTQAALLEAMQERQVTVGGRMHKLGDPFFVLATQNPIEQEGTYPLPEAQLDRFMFNVLVDYPTEDEEFEIVRATTSDAWSNVRKVLSGDDVVELQKVVRRTPAPDHVLRYAMRLVRLTRNDKKGTAPKFVRDYIQWGAGPRASQFLVLAAKTRAALSGRYFASSDDVRAVAAPVLRHRLLTNFNAESEGIKPDDVVARLIDTLPRDESEHVGGGKLPHVLRSAHAG